MSLIRTAFLLLVMTALFIVVGYVLGGQTGILIALGLSIVTHLVSFWSSDKIVLRMHGAIEVDERTAPQFYGIVRDLSARAGIPMPKVCIMKNPQPNAFATGRNPQNAAVCATTGILEILTPQELSGVIAHELAHIKNRDTLTMAMAATIAGAISMLANFSLFFGSRRDNNSPIGPIAGIVIALAAPFAAMLIQMAISRSREYVADREGARITGHPLWLASALRKLETMRKQVRNASAEANPASAHLFIINPLSGRSIDSLFVTHPNTQNRIAALEALAREMGELPSNVAEYEPTQRRAEDQADIDAEQQPGPWNPARPRPGSPDRGPWG